MRRAARNRVLAVAAASGAMAVALPASAVFAADGADAEAAAAGSPGVLSGNNLQVPLSAAVNLCGNTVDVVGLLNPAVGNVCANKDTAKAGRAESDGGSDTTGGASADGRVTDSPGLLSGNGLQLPVDLPVNVSGNSVNAVGVGNPAVGNQSVNGGEHAHPDVPRTAPAPEPSASTPPAPRPQAPRQAVPDTPDTAMSTLAHTGADLAAPALAGAAVSLVAGAVLYRRFRPGH
ncbi:chaplin [Streptomyces sp. BF23-18]|uniref:chaplin n=1 Tax=unclassified Streptomyces TaxID=2593676 RepID=UPI0034E380EE